MNADPSNIDLSELVKLINSGGNVALIALIWAAYRVIKKINRVIVLLEFYYSENNIEFPPAKSRRRKRQPLPE